MIRPTLCARRAGADVLAHQIDAGSSILTRVRPALVDLSLAVLSIVPWQTLIRRGAVNGSQKRTEYYKDYSFSTGLFVQIHISLVEVLYIGNLPC